MKRGWEIKKLSEIGKVFNGNSINERVKKDKYTGLDDGLPFIATKDVGFNSEIDYENGVRIPFNEINQFKIAPSKTPLICAEGGSAGRKIGFTNQDVCFGNKLFAFDPNKNVDSKYVFYYYFTSSFQKHFSTEMAGIIGGVSMNKFKKIEIPLPTLPEQQRIVSILDEAFAAIAKTKANAEQNLQNAKELFESYLQGVFEKKGGGWEDYNLEDNIKLIDYRGRTPQKTESGVRLITAKNVKLGYLQLDPQEFIAEDNYESWMTRGIPNIGDVIFTTEAPLANVAQIESDEKLAFAQRIIVMQSNRKKLNPTFLKYMLLSEPIRKRILKKGTGATVVGIKSSLLKKISICFPKSIEEQQTIVLQLDALRAETQELEAVYQKKIDDLEELKKSMLQKAFNGELTTN